MFSLEFWKATLERVVVTFAEAFGGYIVIAGFSDLSFDWGHTASVAGMASLLALLKCIVATSPVIPGDGPSLVPDEQVVSEDGTLQLERDLEGNLKVKGLHLDASSTDLEKQKKVTVQVKQPVE